MDWSNVVRVFVEREVEPLALLDCEGDTVLVNEALARQLGRSLDALLDASSQPSDVPGAEGWKEIALRGSEAGARGVLGPHFELRRLGEGTLAVIVRSRRPGDSEGAYDDMVIEASPDAFGQVAQAFAGASRSAEAQSTSLRCYELLKGCSSACADCGAPQALGSGRRTIRVHRTEGGYDLIFFLPLDSSRVRVIRHALGEESVAKIVDARVHALAEDARLTERERAVFELLVLGRSRKDIATALGISPRTVRFHEANLLDKLGADSRQDLLRLLIL